MSKTDRISQFSSIRQIIAIQAKNNPSKCAISAPGRLPLGYAQLQALIEANLAILNGMGIGHGDRVAIVLPNGPEMATSFLTVAAGATAAPLNPAYQAPEFELYLSDLKAKALLIQAGMDSPARLVAVQLAIPIIELIPCPNQAAGVFIFSGATVSTSGARYAGPNEEALVLHTSGTTSQPKIVPLSQHNICTSAQNIVTTLVLTADDRCLSIMPLFHIHGLMAAIMASLAAGAEVICCPSFNRDHFFDWLRQCRPTWYTAVPTMHMAILEMAAQHREAIDSVSLRFLRSSSASLPPQVMFQLEDVFNAPVIEAYGMTEAAHQMASNPLPPAAHKAGSVGCAAGPEVAIMDEVGLLLVAGETGEIVIRGDNVTKGYENNPVANSCAFTNDWFRTGDQGRIDEEGYLYITGRLKEIINRGGEKVSPREVDEALLDHPDVFQAIAFAVPHESLGEDVAAAVVLKANATVTAQELRRGLFGRLAEFKIPNRILIVDEIPKGPTGKMQRVGLADKLAGQFQDSHIAPRNPTEELLAEIFKEVLGNKLVGVNENFFSAGGDSLSGARVISRVRSMFLCDLPITTLFHYPTIAELAQEISQNAQPERPTFFQRKGGAYPLLSLAQQRLWFIEQLEPENSINNVTRTLHLRGYLDQAALEYGINKIIGRHEILRTSFYTHDGQAVQYIGQHLPFNITTIDLIHLSQDQQKDEAKRIARNEAHHSFNLAQLPLMRVTLLQLGQQEHVLIITSHHIVSDGWSMGVFSRELEVFYRSALLNDHTELPEPTIQYSDYAEWQHDWLQGKAISNLIDYWKIQLSNATRLELPADRPHAKQPDYNTALCSLQLSAELTKKIRLIGQEENCTLFMTLLTCFNVLLHRYTNETDIVVGTPISGRYGLDQYKDSIGCFVNTLALRTDLSGDPSFRQMLGRVRKMALEAYRHSALPFDKLVEILRPDRSAHRNPLFDIIINLQEASWRDIRLDGLGIEELRLAEPLTDFALTLELFLENERLHLKLMYHPALFDECRINRMLGHLKTLLEGCVANPDLSISKLFLLTEDELQQILKDWNNTGKEYPSNKCIHALFEEQVQATPDAVALIFENQQLTYGELNARANRLAHYLRELGVAEEMLVAICLERSLEMIVSLLGVLKSGGAYVPLDPEYPAERLAFMLTDSAATVVITQVNLLERLPSTGAKRICLDADWPQIMQQPNQPPASTVTPRNLAYMIYTSGSTGAPKGVTIEHRSIASHCYAIREHFQLSAADRVFQSASLSFDVSVDQILPALSVGACVVLGRHKLREPEEFDACIRKHGVTVLSIPPAFFQLWVQLYGTSYPPPEALRLIILGGDTLAREPVMAWRALPNVTARLINGYGPTEATIWATYYIIPDSPEINIPIGRPINNTLSYVLDRHQQPVPVGVAGELYIGGIRVARGYLNRPELTAERFIPNPFSNEPDARLYRTGDLVRYREDGNLEFLGRIDHQVKIRGFRIELGEIEAALREFPAVRDVAVLAREDCPGDKRLVAYISLLLETFPTPVELREFLLLKLPDYMVPSAYVMMESLPFTSNGKLDRKALPAPNLGSAIRTEVFVAPTNPVEQALSDIWVDVLAVEQVSIHDNFFELGGHSLLATRVISRINCTFGTQLPLREIFESPTIAGLAQSLLVNKSLATQEATPQKNTLKALTDRSSLPLSFAQQRLWFLDQLEHGSANYNIPCAYRIRGSLDIGALRHALNEVVRRHESLRTTFAMQGDEPVQVIAPDLELAIPLLEANDEATLHNLIIAEANKTFDLQQGPLLNAQIIRLAPEDHALFFNQHHIISDGWSMGVLLRELNQLYAAFINGEPSPLAEPGLQYADYAVWQRQQGEALAKQLDYWKQKLAAPPVLELPTDRSRPPVQRYRGAILSWPVDAPLTTRLKQLAQQEHATLFMLLMAAFQTLLYRYSGQEDFTIGSPVAGRNHAELEGMIGLFVNTMVLRADLSGSPTFLQLLAQVRETSLAAYSHQDVPFEKLVEELMSTRDMSRNPLFQVMFVLQNTPSSQLALNGAEVEPIEIPIETGKFDLSLAVTESNQGLECTFNYNTDLFDKTTIERMAGHLQNLLQEVVANPERSVAELPLMTEDEKQQILKQWNNTNIDYQNDATIQQLIEQQVDKTPDAIALVFNEHQLSYRELNKRANQLAYYLRSKGVGPDVLVGICLERSLELVIGLLGILKAGGAYVPLDPGYPQERLAFMIEDARAPVLLTQQGLLGKLQSFDGVITCLDQEQQTIAAQPHTNLPAHAAAKNLAYVIYTSGSTGRPKGVAIEHRSVVTFLHWTAEVFSDNELAGTLFSTSVCFDLSVFELFAPLNQGGTVIVVENALQLLTLLGAQQITLINTVPSAITELLRMCAVPATVRTINLAGEPLPGSLARDIYELQHVDKLFNLYGPTEDTIYSTFALIARGDDGAPTIGRPIANSQTYILDRHGEPVPEGVHGELYVAGAGLARGYLNRPELTAEKFLPDPFSAVPGSRMYRTGDLARYLPNGNIEYLGRIDFQVKLRGFRIELGEIESVLRQHPLVKNAVAIVREDTPGDKRLVAYVVAERDAVPPHALINMLKAKLPEYMVPADIVFLETLPLTSSGKIDRKSLPAPVHDRSRLVNQYIAPRTPYEKEIARIWGEVMSLENSGIHDNFFELGGHSLLATRVISRINCTFGTQLPLREIFESPTIAGLAQSLLVNKSLATQEATPQKNTLKALTDRSSLPLSFAQQRLWFLDQLEHGSANYNIPCAYRIRGSLDIGALRHALNEVVRRHESLRTTFAMQGDEPVQVIAPDLELAIPLLEANDEATLHNLIIAEANKTFDLQQGPLLNAQIIRLAPEDHALFFNQHHIISDGWSMGVLLRELNQLYAAFINGEPSPLAEPGLQYADYAVWQRQQGEALAKQLDYWKQKLAAPPVLELPTDRSRPPVQRYRGAILSWPVDAPLTTRLKQLAQQEHATLFMLLMAAFQTLLYRYSGQEDFTIGSPVAGRNHAELEGMIGLFVNTMVLRADLSGSPTFLQLLAQVRETSLAAYSHQDVPFEKLVEELMSTRDMSRNPLFQVMFVLQNTPSSQLALNGAEVEPIEIPIETGKFDLSLAVTESNQGLECTFNYNTDLFDKTTIERMAGHLQNLLQEVVANPERSVAELPLMTEDEKRTLLVTWNDTRRDFPTDKTIHALFEEQVQATPDAVALIFENQQLSYAELNDRANQLAHLLIAKGIEAEMTVALLMDRSPESLISILAILKAGGAYVPLDPKHPWERLKTILCDAAPKLLLTSRDYREALKHVIDIPVLHIETLRAELETIDSHNPNVSLSSRHLAYVLYTSGSTGIPKGVMIEHGSVINLACALQSQVFDNFEKSPLRVALNTAITFDASVQQWTRLLWGDCIVILPEEVSRDTQALVAALRVQHSDVLGCSPTQLRLMFDEGLFNDEGSCPAIVLCGGEAIDAELWRLASTQQHSHIYNVYGPTECTVDSTICLLDAKTGIPNIGRPLPNVQAYILDRNHQPRPIGIPGELWLGGAGVGRGYLNKPELTATSFIPDFYRNSANAYLYRTGDLARYLPDGNIEYLGRIDFQVKLRGFRIELGEIESLLRQHTSVKDAVVILREDRPGDQRLAAYVIPSNSAVNTLELTNMLKAKLPEYMVPADIVFLETLPLTSSGKIDRKSLPAPVHDRSRLVNQYIAPRTPYEKEIARIWGEVMSLENSGIHDNFFELGGHSLLATRVISRINCTFGTQLPLREIFESPTIAGLAQSLLVNKSLATQEATPQKNTLKALTDRSSLPLSFAQQRLWFLDQLEHGSANYNIPCAYRIRGSLDIGALRHALNEVVRRHESLRTTFAMQGDEPVQVIAPDLELAIPLLEANDEATLHNLIIAEANKTFDLQQGPLLNAQIIRLAPEDHALFFNQHHIISDGWSMGVLLRELNQLYAAFINGEPSPLAEPGLQYADYAVWQRQQGEALAKQLDYWKQKLAAPPVLELPTDRSRPPVQRYRGAILSWPVDAPLTTRLKQLAQQEHATLFMLLMAAFQTLLYRYSGQEDFTIGSPVAGRNHAELEGMIGLFVNTMVLRADLSGSPTFLQLLAQVRETSLAAYSHQDVPFEKLVEELMSTRDMSRNPLFQVMFVLQNTPSSQLALNGAEVEPIEIPIETGKFDLSLAVTESNQGLECTFNYNTDLFDKTTIERMAGHLQNLLQEVVANPERSVAELHLMTEDEKQQILKQWNNTNVDYQNDATIQQLIEQQVDKTPDAIALVFNEHKLSYRELNKRANQLAHHLISEGVRPETLIGICLERSLEMVVAILGVLKSGAAYVPLDPALPVARLKDILNDAQMPLLLCCNNTATNLADTLAKRIALDGDWPIIADSADINPAPGSNLSNAAYVIYTSGSTGKPKGVINHQAGICNRLLWMQQTFQLSGNDAVLQKTPYSFDVSVWEFIWPLMTGARLVLAKPEGHKDPVYLNHIIDEQNITVIHFVPSMLQLFLDVLEEEQHCCSLRYVICSGEALNSKLVKRYYNRLNAPLHNLYGPTEAAIDVTHWRCLQNASIGNVPIGEPIANTYIRLFDAQLRLVPIGIAGELYIGGVQLARGYLNRSELTAERFIKDPYSEDSDARLYRTGDLARYVHNGNIEYLGRIDFQVKLRGFRIELGEIECLLRQHAAVKDAVVILREDRPGDQRLAAYVIPSNSAVNPLELTNMLKAKLPEYMVPADMVLMEKLPLTVNGKIDRKALSAPCATVADGAGLKSHSTLEFHLIKIWEDLLDRRPIGIQDNFFELGGHSLLAVRLFNLIEKHFGQKLPLDTLWLEGATIEVLARILKQEQRAVLWPELVQIKTGGGMMPLFCIHTFGGNLFHYYEMARALSTQLPVYGLQARGVYCKQTPRDNISDIASDCINAMRQRQAHGPYRIAGFSSGGIVAFEMAQQLHAAGEEVSCLALIDCYAPGVRLKRDFWKGLYKTLTFQDLRWHQERIYHRFLHTLGLRRLRKMKTIGEIHRWAHWSYKPTPYLGRIDLFLAAESEKYATDPLLGWSKVAKGDLVVHSLPGTHGFLVKPPCVDALAEKLQHILDRISHNKK